MSTICNFVGQTIIIEDITFIDDSQYLDSLAYKVQLYWLGFPSTIS